MLIAVPSVINIIVSAGSSGAGASGIVIVRYAGFQKASGGTVTTNAGYTIHTFTTGVANFKVFQL